MCVVTLTRDHKSVALATNLWSHGRMQPRTEELLYVLLWTADSLMRPTWCNLTSSFEEWAWHNRLGRRLAELERQKLVERRPGSAGGRIVRLTREGVWRALGGRDPATQWGRSWDGRWRMVLFDLPAEQSKLRQQLRRVLHVNHFGYLQDSVWITPDSVLAVRANLRDTKVDPAAVLVMEGRPAAGESDAEIVQAAWNFPEINRRYEQYLRLVRGAPPGASGFRAWALRENELWKKAVQFDPLLPTALLPKVYAGLDAFETRKRILGILKTQHTQMD